MLWLAIESATLVAGVALGRGDRVLAEISSQVALTHSERLLPMVDQALTIAAVGVKDLEGIFVAAGPGSFTGLRIGLATAKGLAHARNCPLYAVSTLEALAWQQAPGLVVPLLDARRGQVYAAIYRRRENHLECVEGPMALALKDLLQRPPLAHESARFAGEGAIAYRQLLQEKGDAIFANPSHNWPRASSLALAALANGRAPRSVHELRPTYIRASQAEQKLRER